MKLWVLMENTACSEAFAAEHGLSLYLETGKRRILFDMGQSAAFARNAEILGIDLAAVDTAILSHGHYDHGGGLSAFLGCNSGAPICVSPYAFEPHYGKSGKNIGLDPALQDCGRLVYAAQDLSDGLSLHSCNDLVPERPIDPAGLSAVSNGNLIPEDFRHEQYLLVQEAGRRILISGCSHKGIVNIVRWLRPNVLVGGFHLRDIPPEDPAIDEIASALLESDTVYYTGHCTGQGQFDRLKQRMGDRLRDIRAGMTLEI